MLHINYYIHMN